MQSIEPFERNLIEADFVMDPAGVHHELASGMHGQKLDFDAIPNGSELFNLWVGAVVVACRRHYWRDDPRSAAILSVANGTNRLVQPVADMMGNGVAPLLTEKAENRKVILTEKSRVYIEVKKPSLVVVLEDVGTSGGTVGSAVLAAINAGAENVEVLTTFQRRERLERLDKLGINYRAIIKRILPTYTPEECRESGFCAQGWDLVPKLA